MKAFKVPAFYIFYFHTIYSFNTKFLQGDNNYATAMRSVGIISLWQILNFLSLESLLKYFLGRYQPNDKVYTVYALNRISNYATKCIDFCHRFYLRTDDHSVNVSKRKALTGRIVILFYLVSTPIMLHLFVELF